MSADVGLVGWSPGYDAKGTPTCVSPATVRITFKMTTLPDTFVGPDAFVALAARVSALEAGARPHGCVCLAGAEATCSGLGIEVAKASGA